jgi:hypothetical protein
MANEKSRRRRTSGMDSGVVPTGVDMSVSDELGMRMIAKAIEMRNGKIGIWTTLNEYLRTQGLGDDLHELGYILQSMHSEGYIELNSPEEIELLGKPTFNEPPVLNNLDTIEIDLRVTRLGKLHLIGYTGDRVTLKLTGKTLAWFYVIAACTVLTTLLAIPPFLRSCGVHFNEPNPPTNSLQTEDRIAAPAATTMLTGFPKGVNNPPITPDTTSQDDSVPPVPVRFQP